MVEKRPLILIVDDVALNRALLSDILSDKYNIIEAENGNEALLLLREKTSEISLVLLDMVMPEKDGLEVLAIMNKNGWINEIPVIMISAENAHALIEGAYMLGVTDFIGRPFDEMVLKNRVNNTIRQKAKKSLRPRFKPDLRKDAQQQHDGDHAEPHRGIPQWRKRNARAAHQHHHRNAFARAPAPHKKIPDQQKRHRHYLYGIVHARHRENHNPR